MRRIVAFRGRFNMRFWGGSVAVLMLSLSGCQLVGKGDAPSDIAAPTALQGPAVEVTALPPIGSSPAVEQAKPAVPKQTPAAPAEPVKAKTPGQIACETLGGSFVVFGTTGAMTCQMPTRDGGKLCQRESDCDGVCLARSNTCAPVKPLLGCQDILQNDGRRVELCID